MSPKCPFCGGKLGVVNSIVNEYWGECKKGCFITKRFKTKSEALAAASKRFVPKRSAEEIAEKFLETSILWQKEFDKFALRHLDVPREYKRYLFAIRSTRIADYIHGVTE